MAEDEKWSFIQTEMKYIRGRVDDVFNQVSDLNSRLTAIEREQKQSSRTQELNMTRERVKNERRIYIIAIFALVVSIITMVTKFIT